MTFQRRTPGKEIRRWHHGLETVGRQAPYQNSDTGVQGHIYGSAENISKGPKIKSMKSIKGSASNHESTFDKNNYTRK